MKRPLPSAIGRTARVWKSPAVPAAMWTLVWPLAGSWRTTLFEK